MNVGSVHDYFIGEETYPDLPAQAAVERLSGALQCRTVGFVDTRKVDYSQFDRLHQCMQQGFPHVMAAAQYREIGHSVLFTLPGSNASLRPALFMSHQDVVPVVEGTEADWRHDAFSGAVAEGYIWGRGALDIKNMVFGILEAAEYLLAHGRQFARTVYLAFGEDEETLNTGAAALAQFLAQQGVSLEFVLDEGGGHLQSGDAYGAPQTALLDICIGEKGYLDLTLQAQSTGGHSSDPWFGTSLGALAHAIDVLQTHPYTPRLDAAMRGAFEALQPFVTEEPLRTLVQDLSANEAELTKYCMSRRELYNLISTTVAPTMITPGSSAGNVMPQAMQAVVNFRLARHDTAEAVLQRSQSLVGAQIGVGSVQHNNASALARTDTGAYAALTSTMRRFVKSVQFVPTVSAGATDARQYEGLCDTCLRFSPFLEDAELTMTGVHGTNERISVRSYLQGIRCLIAFMEETCL